jgi:hypothetical protein
MALISHGLLLAGCALPATERRLVASEDADKLHADSLACTQSEDHLTAWLAESMLAGLTVGAGPAVIESGTAAKQKNFEKCMNARKPPMKR